MATTVGRRVARPPQPPQRRLGAQIASVLSSTDHKVIGKMYLATSFTWFLVGGLLALLMRSELAFPGTQIGSVNLAAQARRGAPMA